MGTIKEVSDRAGMFVSGFRPMLEACIVRNRGFVEMAVRDQLESGVDGNEKELRPNYLNDPYFKTRKEAERYMRWKERITPPRESVLGLRPRAVKTPNLRINGFYHQSIRALATDGGVRVVSGGVDFSPEVEHKYGGALYKLGRTARRKFYRDYLRKELRAYYRRFGL